jgi:hypothetical protein
VKRVLRRPAQPLKAIGVNELRFADAGGFVGECEVENGVLPAGYVRWLDSSWRTFVVNA